MTERNELFTAFFALEHKVRRAMAPRRPRGLRFMGPGPQVPPEAAGRPRPPFPGAGHDMTFSRRRILSVLHEKETCSASELAEILDVRPSSVTEMLNKLESRNYITRTKDPKDSRSTLVQLTDEGKKAFEERQQHLHEKEGMFGANLTEEEKKTFIQLCKKIEEGLVPPTEDEQNKTEQV